MAVNTISIPYDKGTVQLEVDERNLIAVITPVKPAGAALADGSGRQIVLEALRNPIGTPTLRHMAAGKSRVLLITCDHTRAMPSRITLPILLEEIRAGAPEAQIDILIATGSHRATTESEQRAMFGDEIVDNESVYVHDCTKSEDMREVCTLPSGAVFKVNRMALECDLLVSEGFIEPHFFAGFSGGRKSVMPGIASIDTINVNHSYKALSSPFATSGVLRSNPVHADMVAAARAAGLAFILNVALDAEKQIIAAFSGDMEAAHLAGCDYVSAFSRRPVVTGDIVITGNGGYPLDQNLYQAPKSASTAAMCAGEDGVIIMVGGCADGFGGQFFRELMLSGPVPAIIDRLAAIPPEETIPEQWCVQVFARIMMKHKVILVTSGIGPDLVKQANFIYAESPGEALEIAYAIKGRDAKVVVIPDGVAVVVTSENAM